MKGKEKLAIVYQRQEKDICNVDKVWVVNYREKACRAEILQGLIDIPTVV